MIRNSKNSIDYKDENNLIRRYLKRGMTQKEIAVLMDKTPTTIRNRMREMGLLNQKKVEGGKKGYKKTVEANSGNR